MARLVNAVVLGLAAVGGAYAVHDAERDGWLIDRAAGLIRVAAEGAAVPRVPQVAVVHNADDIPWGQPNATAVEAPGDVDALVRMRFVAPAELQIGQTSDQSATAKVAIDPPLPVRVAEAGASRPAGNAKDVAPLAGAGDDPRQRLARSIQIELARVGCYSGAIDGDWSPDTRKAMKAFNDRVNATLPIAHPDYILLTLLQGHAAKACGTLCPPGQAEAADGVCTPRSVLAEARRRTVMPSGSTQATGAATTSVLSAQGTATRVDEATPGRHAATARIENEADVLAQRKAAADKALAEAERARRETESLVRRKAAADQARAAADADKERIRAQEERKRQQIAEAEARAEAERLTALAAAEKSRAAAEARRRAELDAVAARDLRIARATVESAPLAVAPPALPAAPAVPASLQPPVGAVAEPPPPPVAGNVGPRAIPKPPEARFVGRFVPPPTYRVGRLPPSPQPRAAAPATIRAAAVPRVRTAPTGAIFRYLQHHSP